MENGGKVSQIKTSLLSKTTDMHSHEHVKIHSGDEDLMILKGIISIVCSPLLLPDFPFF